jgi:hypothetical protein
MVKKSFKDNPALHFITIEPSSPEAAVSDEKSPAGEVPMKLNPVYVETKSRRLQLLLQPSLHLRLKARAAREQQSLNNLIHSALTEWLRNTE